MSIHDRLVIRRGFVQMTFAPHESQHPLNKEAMVYLSAILPTSADIQFEQFVDEVRDVLDQQDVECVV